VTLSFTDDPTVVFYDHDMFIIQATGASTVKLLMGVIVTVSYYAKVFATAIHFNLSLTWAGKTGALQDSTLMVGS
jgi:hypothetical protein